MFKGLKKTLNKALKRSPHDYILWNDKRYQLPLGFTSKWKLHKGTKKKHTLYSKWKTPIHVFFGICIGWECCPFLIFFLASWKITSQSKKYKLAMGVAPGGSTGWSWKSIKWVQHILDVLKMKNRNWSWTCIDQSIKQGKTHEYQKNRSKIMKWL